MSTWWIAEGRVLASHNPTHTELERLRADGFTTIVSLLDARQPPIYDPSPLAEAGWTRHTIEIREGGVPSVEQLELFTRLLRDLPAGSRVVVHCQSGSGRTSTMGAAYWIDHGLSASEAIEKIRRADDHAWDTEERTRALDELEQRLRAQARRFSNQ